MITLTINNMSKNTLENTFLRGLREDIHVEVILFKFKRRATIMRMVGHIELKNKRLRNCAPHRIYKDSRIEGCFDNVT